jgi:integrase
LQGARLREGVIGDNLERGGGETRLPLGRERFDHDLERGLASLSGAYADRTVRECAFEFRRLRSWCEARGLSALPASPQTLAAMVDVYFESCTPRTVEGRLWYVRILHRALAYPDPTDTDEVRLAFRKGCRTMGARRRRARSRQAAPVNAALKARLSAVCGQDLIGLRDRALLSLGYDTLCRQSELVELRIENLERLPEGSARILVTRSKADPFGRGEYVYLTATGLAHVDAWLAAAGLVRGPILRGVHFRTRVGHRSLHCRLIIQRLRHRAREAGLPPQDIRGIGGHSLRVGAAHDLAVSGATLTQIMRAGRWRSYDSVAHYVRDAPVNIWAALEDGEGAAAQEVRVLADRFRIATPNLRSP